MVNKDNSIATITSSIGEASGTPKFQTIIANSQIKKTFIKIIIS